MSSYSDPFIIKLFIILFGFPDFVKVTHVRTIHHKYYLIKTTSTWSSAQSYCREMYTDLATAVTDEDWVKLNNEAVISGLKSSAWIGLYKYMNIWKWSDQSIVSTIPWGSGQPDNSGGNENCAVGTAQLNDIDCNYLYYFFCHTILPVREQQIVRLQVKSDGSVLDPAVQSSILDQVKRKLLEKGMLENTTVTWRVQPDGNIFQKKKKDL